MREILFRGKRAYDGEWVEGNLFIPDKEDTPTQICIGTNIVRITYDIIPETVGQYTGLTDENGIEMYEGDIIHGAAHWLERYVPAVVTFRNGSFGLLWYRGEVEEFNPFTSMCNVEYTVVGNIYDNPELMKGGE